MTEITGAAENIYMMDNRLFSLPKWGSVYLIDEAKKALVECGPTTSVDAVLEGIREIGLRPEDIDYLVVTHIHLDHSGGAGMLMKHLHNAQFVVHPRGALHLIDPTRLVAAAEDARGGEVMSMHGAVFPIDADRVLTVNDGDTISLGAQQTLTFLHTPGHAPHHLCIYESRNGGVFTGDALAMYVSECDILLPYHPPPQFDLELCLATLRRLEELSARKIYYSHFGVTDEASGHIALARKKLLVWDGIARKAAAEGAFSDLKDKLTADARADLEPMKGVESLAPLYDYLVNRSIPMCAEGHIAYYRKVLNIG